MPQTERVPRLPQAAAHEGALLRLRAHGRALPGRASRARRTKACRAAVDVRERKEAMTAGRVVLVWLALGLAGVLLYWRPSGPHACPSSSQQSVPTARKGDVHGEEAPQGQDRRAQAGQAEERLPVLRRRAGQRARDEDEAAAQEGTQEGQEGLPDSMSPAAVQYIARSAAYET